MDDNVLALIPRLEPIVSDLDGRSAVNLGVLIAASILTVVRHDPDVTAEEIKATLLGAEQSVAAYATMAREIWSAGADSIQ